MKRTTKRPVMKLQFMNLVRDCEPCETTNGLTATRKALLLLTASYFDSDNSRFCVPYEEAQKHWNDHGGVLSHTAFIAKKSGFGQRTITNHFKELAQWGWIRFVNVAPVDGQYDYRILPPEILPCVDGQYVIHLSDEGCNETTPPMQLNDRGVYLNNTPPNIQTTPPPTLKLHPYIYKVIKTLKTLKTEEGEEDNNGVNHTPEGDTPPPPIANDSSEEIEATQEQLTGNSEDANINREPQGIDEQRTLTARRFELAKTLVKYVSEDCGVVFENSDQLANDMAGGLRWFVRQTDDDELIVDRFAAWMTDRWMARHKWPIAPEDLLRFALVEESLKAGWGEEPTTTPRNGHDPTLGGRAVRTEEIQSRVADAFSRLEGE